MTGCAEVSDNFDLSYNFVQKSDELSPEDIMSDDGITPRTQSVNMQHDNPALSKLFALAKAGNQGKSSTLYEIRNDVLARRSRDRIVGLEVTQVVVPSALFDKLLRISHALPTSGHIGAQKTFDRLARHGWHEEVSGTILPDL